MPVKAESSINRTVVMKEMAVDKGSYPKRKVVLPAEITRMDERKRPRKGEVIYAEACGKERRNLMMDEDYSEDSEGWRRVERRKREWRAPLGQDIPSVHPGNNREMVPEGCAKEQEKEGCDTRES